MLHQGKVRTDAKIRVPQVLQERVIAATHEFAHPGVAKKTEMVNRKYFFHKLPGKCSTEVNAPISKVVNQCTTYQTLKQRRGLQPESLQSFPIPEYPFGSICMNFPDLTSTPVQVGKNEYDYVLLLVCRLTGYVIVVLCQQTLTSSGLAQLFLDPVVQFMGFPQQIFTDHDHLVTAEFYSTLCSPSGIDAKTRPIF